MSSSKINGTSTTKRDLSEKTNGGSTTKRDLSEKTNGGSTLRKENLERGNGSAIVKRDSADVKKEASISGSKTILKKSSTVTKAVKKEETSTVTKTVKKEEKKKVFTLPGQKHEPPEEREPLRIFYESLFEQRPDSEMAEIWMMEHGLLTPEHAKRAFEKKQKRGTSFGTPVKSSTSTRENSKVSVKTSVSTFKASGSMAKIPGSNVKTSGSTVKTSGSSVTSAGSNIKTTGSNGKQSASKVPEQKGKRKWEHDDSDDDLVIARPLKRKLKT